MISNIYCLQITYFNLSGCRSVVTVTRDLSYC